MRPFLVAASLKERKCLISLFEAVKGMAKERKSRILHFEAVKVKLKE